MKTVFILASILFVIPGFSWAQYETYTVNSGQKPIDVIPDSVQYVLPKFAKGVVFFKDGTKNSSLLNYNTLFQEMLFIAQGKDTLAISQPEKVDKIVVGEKTFYFQKQYLKSIKQGQNFEIAEKPLFSFSDVKKNGAMGTKNSTMSIDAVKFDQSRAMGEARMVANDIITLRKTSWYYFRQNKETFLLVSKRNLAKVYGKDQVQEYMKKNSVDFDKVEDIEKAILHFSTQ